MPQLITIFARSNSETFVYVFGQLYAPNNLRIFIGRPHNIVLCFSVWVLTKIRGKNTK